MAPWLSARTAYALRGGLCIGVASLLLLLAEHVKSVDSVFMAPLTMLAPAFAAVVVQPLLGHAFRAASHVVIGTTVCLPFIVAASALVGWQTNEAVFGTLVVLSLLFAMAPLPQLSAKCVFFFFFSR